ncbi:MAG: STAS domain-containing protein, partial [Thermoanaerobaculia bacterium]
AVKGADRIELDLSGSRLVNVPALEILLKAKRILSDKGVPLTMVGAVPAVAKVLQLMKVAGDVKRARQ